MDIRFVNTRGDDTRQENQNFLAPSPVDFIFRIA